MPSNGLQPSVYFIKVEEGEQPRVILGEEMMARWQMFDKKPHRYLAATQISIGIFCILLELTAALVGLVQYLLWCGLHAGLLFFLTGLLGLLADVKRSRCFLIGCIVMSIVCPLVSVVEIIAALIEMRSIAASGSSHGLITFQKIKECLIISCCIAEIFISIIHASYASAACCRCCWPPSALCSSVKLPDAVFSQSTPSLGQEEKETQSLPPKESLTRETKGGEPVENEMYSPKVYNWPVQLADSD